MSRVDVTRLTSMKPRPGPAAAALAYVLLSIVLTWPLALGLGRDVPGDLGDSLLNMWILSWGAEHVPRLLTGAISWAAFWNANIFHPDPLALTFSEHLFGQTLQILPVYWITGNVILSYNLLFISTFAVSGFGAYLLVRDLTGDCRAAFFAGLIYGFLPYRMASVPHLQVMSSQWMPFALYGLNRFVMLSALPHRGSHDLARAKAGALAGGTAALVMQNWSCGYYLLYFAPFAPLFVVHRMWAAGTLRDLRVWIALAVAAAVTLVLTLPFLLPYSEAQQRYGFERSFGEVVSFSANLWSYVTAAETLRLWGHVLRFYPHGEGEAFLGFVPWILAFVAAVAAAWTAVPERSPGPRSLFRVGFAWLLLLTVVVQGVALLSAVIFGGFDATVFGLTVRARTPVRLLMQFAAAGALLLVLSTRARLAAGRLARSPEAFFAAATIVAIWLSLGPVPYAGDRHVSGLGLYGVLYEHVPGFNGVRVPARYAMIAGLFLAVLAGFGAAVLTKRRWGAWIVAVAGVLALLEGAAAPIEVNHGWAQNEATPPSRVFPAREAPPVYARIAALPAGTAITEFPFGDAAWEIRYVYYAAAHWKPITNGYSGAFPPAYTRRVARLQNVAADPAAAWDALLESGTTHVVVHDAAFARPGDAAAVRQWLLSHDAAVVERFADGDTLYNVRPQMRM